MDLAGRATRVCASVYHTVAEVSPYGDCGLVSSGRICFSILRLSLGGDEVVGGSEVSVFGRVAQRKKSKMRRTTTSLGAFLCIF